MIRASILNAEVLNQVVLSHTGNVVKQAITGPEGRAKIEAHAKQRRAEIAKLAKTYYADMLSQAAELLANPSVSASSPGSATHRVVAGGTAVAFTTQWSALHPQYALHKRTPFFWKESGLLSEAFADYVSTKLASLRSPSSYVSGITLTFRDPGNRQAFAGHEWAKASFRVYYPKLTPVLDPILRQSFVSGQAQLFNGEHTRLSSKPLQYVAEVESRRPYLSKAAAAIGDAYRRALQAQAVTP
jgi:hypothetical protein